MATELWRHSPLASPDTFDTLFGLEVNGFRKKNGGNKVPHSGIINQPFNYLCMANQKCVLSTSLLCCLARQLTAESR